jgi:hypothetical protein
VANHDAPRGLLGRRSECETLDRLLRSVRSSQSRTLIGVLLVLVVIPVAINSRQTDATTVRQQDVQAVAQHWAEKAGWAVVAVSASGKEILIRATGPDPAPSTATLRQDLDDAGLSSVPARVSLAPATYQAVPAQG